MKKSRIIMMALAIAYVFTMLPLCASAADTGPTVITGDEPVYGTVGWKHPQDYAISVYGSGDLVMDLKTPSSICICLRDSDGEEIPPFNYEEQTNYGSHAGHDISGYYLSYPKRYDSMTKKP